MQELQKFLQTVVIFFDQLIVEIILFVVLTYSKIGIHVCLATEATFLQHTHKI